MVALEQVTNRCGSAEVFGQKPVSMPAGGVPSEIRRGVGKPGGFTNTNDDPRAGGAVVLPGGITNTSFPEERPDSPLPRLGNRSFSPEISARNKPVGLVSDGK